MLFWLAFWFWGFSSVCIEAKPCSGSATYKLSFQAEWRNTTSRPNGASFSGLIGCSHNRCYQMWAPGRRASVGVKNLAEKGVTTDLYAEILQHVHKKTASKFIESRQNFITPEGHVILPQTNTTRDGFLVDALHPYVSIIAQIHPSPDWFIGVHDFDLCNRSDGEWLMNRRETLFPYDAGTKSGIYFNSGNDSTRTYKNIFAVQYSDLQANGVVGGARGIGYFYFTLLKKFSLQNSESVTDITFPCVASLAQWSWYIFLPVMIVMFG